MVAQYDPAFELYLDLSKYIDLKEELARLDKEIGKLQKELNALEKKLENENFVARAPEEKVVEARDRRDELGSTLSKLQETRQELSTVA